MASFDSLIQDLESYRGLEPDWDSYGGKAIHPKAIEMAKTIAAVLSAEWDCMPTCNGGIRFEIEEGEIQINFLTEAEIKWVRGEGRNPVDSGEGK